MSNVQRKKLPHKIPNKSYLDFFKSLSSNKLYVYNKNKELFTNADNVKPKEIPPKVFLIEQNYYESPIYKINSIENTLADIEGNYLNVLKNKIIKKKELTRNETLIVSYFISTLESRTSYQKLNIDRFIDKVSELFKSNEEQFNEGRITENHKQLLKLKTDNSAFTQSIDISVQLNR